LFQEIRFLKREVGFFVLEYFGGVFFMRNSHKEVVFDNMLQELTEGRPFVFVIMPFKAKWLIYEEINEIIENKIGLSCIRADDVNASGYDLLEKIHLLIERASLVVAEISLPNPNFFYEVGYASAERKNILLLAEKSVYSPWLICKSISHEREPRLTEVRIDGTN
jgi:hypothetical protein